MNCPKAQRLGKGGGGGAWVGTGASVTEPLTVKKDTHMRHNHHHRGGRGREVRGRAATCGTSELVAAVGTVCVAVTDPGVDDASPRATVEAVGGAGRQSGGQSVRSNTVYAAGWERVTLMQHRVD